MTYVTEQAQSIRHIYTESDTRLFDERQPNNRSTETKRNTRRFDSIRYADLGGDDTLLGVEVCARLVDQIDVGGLSSTRRGGRWR